MMPKHWRKHPSDWQEPIAVEVLTTAGPQPWHAEALRLRYEEGLTVRQCAAACGVGFSPMQRFLNPESKAKAKKRQAKWERERRRTDPAYAEKTRTYVRKYMQLAAPGRWKDGGPHG